MYELNLTADELVAALLGGNRFRNVCILDSCGVGHLGSHLLLAGVDPVNVYEISNSEVSRTLATLDDAFTSADLASIFSLSYEFGRKLQRFDARNGDEEPDVFLAQFRQLIVHDYDTGVTRVVGDGGMSPDALAGSKVFSETSHPSSVFSDFTHDAYLDAIGTIKDRIRAGDTYQTNLTQRLRADLPTSLTPETIFRRLRRDHPAPFAAYLSRQATTVVSASPERFFRVESEARTITTSPIKGTRARGSTPDEDERLRDELKSSIKDQAENTMIVDLLRNDLGRVCEYGSVRVEKLCDLEEHPTLFHLVSTVSGRLRPDAPPSDIIRSLFPCGSVTGAPKISTMSIIDEIEPVPRGLSMGAIGCYIPPKRFALPGVLDTSVAIRTMVVRDDVATFNVGGGIVIDSNAESEYEETLTKARALLNAIDGKLK